MKQRQSTFDIIRTLSAIQVIYYHIGQYSKTFFKPGLPYTIIFFHVWAKLCDFNFMLITFYFVSRSKFQFSKLLPIYVQTLEYTVYKYLLDVFFYKKQAFDWAKLRYSLFPMLHDTCGWYTTPFIFSKVVFSYIIPGIQQKGKWHHLKAAVFIAWWAFLYTEGHYRWLSFAHQKVGSNPLPFFVSGFAASFIAFYGKDIKIRWSVILFIISFIWNCYIHKQIGVFPSFSEYVGLQELTDPQILHFSTFVLAVSLFHIAASCPISSSYPTFWQTVAETSYGAFITINSNQAMPQIKRYGISHITNQPFLYLHHTFFATIKLFAGAAIIDIARKKLTDLFVFNRKYFGIFVSIIDYEFAPKNQNEST